METHEIIRLCIGIVIAILIVITYGLQRNEIDRLKKQLKNLKDSLPKDDKIITLSGLEYYNKKLKEDLDQGYVKRKAGKRYYRLNVEGDKCEKCDTYNCGMGKYFYGTYAEAKNEILKVRSNAFIHNINDTRLSITEITKKEYDKETKND